MQKELTTIEGTVLSLIYKNDESGYAVARVMLDDGSQLTIVGIMPFLGAGERVAAVGEVVSHPQHGSQFITCIAGIRQRFTAHACCNGFFGGQGISLPSVCLAMIKDYFR